MTSEHSSLPPELQAFAAVLDAQPGQVQINFQYVLAMLMVEDDKAQLIKTEPGENGAYCTFRTIAGDTFTVLKPPLSMVQETEMVETLRQILTEERD